MASKLVLSKGDHEKIQEMVNLQNEEDYAVVTHRIHGEWKRSIHVFTRLPSTKELTVYENSASKMKFRAGGQAEIQGGSVEAAGILYNKLVTRVYDLPIGNRVFGEVTVNSDGSTSGSPLERNSAIDKVPPLVKREALRDFIGEVYSESRIAEKQGDDDEVKEKSEDD